MSEKSKNYTMIYVPWSLRERLRMLAKKESRTMVALVELMVTQREGRDEST